MVWSLSSAVLRCQRRRLARALRAAPLPGALLVLVLAASPLVAVRGGRSLGRLLQPVLADAEAARSLTLAPLLAGVAAGVAVGAASSARRSLGLPLGAAPVGARRALVACALVPAGAAAALGLPAALALAGTLGASAPGGVVSGAGFLLVAPAGAAVGAALSEAVALALAGVWRPLAPLPLLAAGWIGTGGLLGAPALGPVATVPGSLDGSMPAAIGFPVALLSASAATALWVELAAQPREQHRSATRARLRVRGGLWVALPLSAAALLGRRRELRLALVLALGLGVVGVLLADGAGVEAPAPLLLGASSATLAATIVPLAAAGTLLGGRSTWWSAPLSRAVPCLVVVLVAAAMLAGVAAAVTATAALRSGATASGLAQVLVGVALLGSAATLAGGVVPWRVAGIGDQVASCAAFAVCVAAFSATAAVAGPRLVSLGLPDEAAAAALLGASSSLAFGAVLARLRTGR